MNDNDVFQKSALGREEIKNQTSSVLPREARTLLIFIDGKKTYQQYLALLDKGKMFADVGGVAPFFEILKEFEYIELVTSGAVSPQETQNHTVFETIDDAQNFTTAIDPAPTKQQSADFDYAGDTASTADSDVDNFFNSQVIDRATDPTISENNSTKRQAVDLKFDAVKSKLATYIERRAAAGDVWSHMLNLEQCNNATELLEFIKDIQRTDNGDLAQGIDEFSKMIER